MTVDSAHPTRSAPSAPENRARRRRLARNSGALSGALVLATGSTAALLAAFAGPAGASTTFTVDSSGDGSANAAHCTNGTAFDCTFRDAAAAAANGDTIDFDHIKRHYYEVHTDINPTGVVPKGPDLANWFEPHDRGTLGGRPFGDGTPPDDVPPGEQVPPDHRANRV